MIKEVPLKNVRLDNTYLSAYYKLVCEVVLPYQWDVLNDLVDGAEKSYCISNIRIAAGEAEGTFGGMVFQDSDAAKWLEAVAYCVQNGDAKGLINKADELIALIAKAQMPDGYFNTYYQLQFPDKRFTNLYEAHELYCLGHFIEAATAYAEATGKNEILNVFCKYANLVESMYGTGKKTGYPGHQEIELALVKLYEFTGERRYLELARYFLDERGKTPNFFAAEWEARGGYSIWSKKNEPVPQDFSYNQAHVSVREQKHAVGHAVRAVYMYTAMAEVGRLTQDMALLNACRALTDDIARQIYITGGIGQTNHGEAFTFAYDLPNTINYSETCASVGLVFFMHSMLKVEARSVYADIMENALYNTVLAGLSTDGKSYFYVNPMEVWREASEKNPARKHVTSERQKWHACACCPPNAARLLASFGKYLYTVDESCDTIYTHLYVASTFTTNLSCGEVSFETQTQYPLNGGFRFTAVMVPNKTFTLAFRIPGWCEKAEFALNGKVVTPDVKDGYAYITRQFAVSDCISVNFNIQARVIRANTLARANAGKVCVRRGALVYCIEECDNGGNLSALVIDTKAEFTEKQDSIGQIPCVVLSINGYRETDNDAQLYTYAQKTRKPCVLKFIPYHLWGNRDKGDMSVWVRE